MRPSSAVASLAAAALVLLTGCSGASAPGASATTGSVLSTPDPTTGTWGYAASYQVAAPADLAHPAVAPCARTALPAGWTAAENRRRGTTSWRPAPIIAHPQQTRRVPLYLDAQTTTCGTPVAAHLGGTGASGVTVRAYRIGWYGGAGARLVWTSVPITVPPSPGVGRQGDAMRSPGWRTTVTLPVGPTWTPGEYVVETWLRGSIAGVASLVVRDDVSTAPFLLVHSSLTWSAYSQFDDSSLYKGEDGKSDSRALQADLARPLVGAGLVRLLAEDVPVTQFMERYGFDLRHVDDTTLDAWPSQATSARTLVLPGHSEYWTRRMYDAVVAARNAGVNIADLGANEIYWHARLQRDAAGAPVSMFVARTAAQDPMAASDPQSSTTLWHRAPLRRDPAAVLGQRYSAVRARGSMVVFGLPAWLGAGTGLRTGSLVRGIVANEADGYRVDPATTPPDLDVVMAGVLTQHGAPDVAVSTTYYAARSGAGVFAAGTTYWACDLTGSCPDSAVPAPTASVVRRMTLNLLRAFSVARAGAAHPSTRSVPGDVARLRAVLPPSAIGTYGSGE